MFLHSKILWISFEVQKTPKTKKNDASFLNKCSKDVLEHIFILNKLKFSKSASLWLYTVAKMEKNGGFTLITQFR